MLPDDQHERLDRSFDLILLLIGIITAAMLQYATALEDISFTTFSLRFLFVPLIPLVMFWLWKQITNNRNRRTFIRIFVWLYGIVTLFSDILFFLIVSFFKQLVASKTIIPAIVTSIVLYTIAFLLVIRIIRAYGYEKREVMVMTLHAYSLAISATAITLFLAYLP